MTEKHIPLSSLFGYAAKDKPRFSPNKRYFSFLALNGDSLPALWIADSPTSTPRCLLKSIQRPLSSYSWAHTNQHILFLQDHNGDENNHLHILDITTGIVTNIISLAHVRVQSYAVSPSNPAVIAIIMNRRDRSLYDVYTYNITTNRLQIIARNDGTIKNWYLDGNLKVRAKVAYDDDGSFYLHVRATPRSKWRPVHTWHADDAFNSGPITLSPDGRFLYLADTTQTNTSCLQIMCTTTGERTTIAHDHAFDIFQGANLRELISHQTPPPSILFDHNNNLAAFSYYKESLTWRFLKSSTLDPALEEILSDQTHDYWIADIHSNDDMIIGRSSATHAPSYWHYHHKTLTKLFDTRPALTPHKHAQTNAISFVSRDGLTINGYLTMPPEISNPPIVIRVHGGPWVRDIGSFNAPAQFLASRGYACLQVNFRGSIGYGKTLTNAARKEWGGKMIDDLADAAQWLIDQGIGTPGKIALMGRSYGGFAALSASWRYTALFSCIIAEVPPTSLLAILESCPPYWRPFMSNLYQRLGHPQKNQKRLQHVSPLFNTEHITLPLFISYGTYDARVSDEPVERFINKISSRHKQLTVLPFANEGHTTRRQENLFTHYQAIEQFLGQHLTTEEQHEHPTDSTESNNTPIPSHL